MGKSKNTDLECRAELKKHTCIIHSSNELSLLQRKISNVLLFHAYDSLLEQEEHKISINELCKYLGYYGHNYDALKNALKALISTVLEWNLTDDENKEEDWTASSILASVNIKGAVCSYSYSLRMRKLLFSPSMYGRINLTIQSNFTSSYGLTLYENCVRYRNLGKTKLFSLDVFRKLMGVPTDKYQVFSDFKKRVINKAVEEINALSDIFVIPHIKKTGQKVEGIFFSVLAREKKKILGKNVSLVKSENISEEDMTTTAKDLIEKMISKYKISKATSSDLLKSYGVDKIIEKINLIEKSKGYLNGKIDNISGLLINAIKNDYQESKRSSNVLEEKRIQIDTMHEIKKIKEKNEAMLQKKYSDYVDSKIIEIVNFLKAQKIFDEIKMSFEKYLNQPQNKMVRKNYTENEFDDKIVRIFLNIFLKSCYPHLLIDIETEEDFFKKHSVLR